MAVLITGGAGFIGSNIATALVDMDYDVRIIDNFSTGKKENISGLDGNVEVIKGDIRDNKILEKNLTDVEIILHQAALTSVPRSIKNPQRSNDSNILGSLTMLTAAVKKEVGAVVYASSSSAYGDTPILPKRETMKPTPLSPYAVTKLAGEVYCKVFSEVYGLRTVSLRYFNVYGPRQDPLSQYAAVIPRFISAILKGKRPMIYGDGEQTRDFTYVKDVVEANILAMRKGRKGEVYNIGRGERVTINALAEKICEITGIKVKPEHVDPRKGDVRHSLADISKAKKDLGYEPRYTLEEGLAETIEWFSKNE